MMETMKPGGLTNDDYGIAGKYKWRNVSGHRDFPKGCGRFAPRFNGNQNHNDPVVVDSTVVESEALNSSLSLNEYSKVELSKSLDLTESLHSPKVLKSETLKPVEALDELKAIEPVGPLAMEISKALDQTELKDPLKSLRPETTELLKTFNQVESVESMNDSQNIFQFEDKNMPSGLQHPSTTDAVMINTIKLLNVLDEPETSLHNVGNVGTMHKQYPPRRKVSAVRDFLPGCGRNAPRISQKEHLKLVVQSENQSVENENSSGDNQQSEQMVKTDDRQIRDIVKDEDDLMSKLKRNVMKDFVANVRVKSDRDLMKVQMEHFQVRPVSQTKLEKEDLEENRTKSPAISNLPRSDRKPLSVSERVGKDIAHSGGKLGKESLKINRDNSFNREVPKGANRATNQSQVEESIGLGLSNERRIVLALMAAPNCPWTQLQAKHGFNSLDQGTTKHKLTKQESMVHTREKDGVENSKGKFTKVKAAYEVSDQLVNKNEEEGSLGHNGADENLSLVSKPKDHSMSLIPFGLHPLLHKDDNCEAVATRNKVRETLRLFQAIFRKLLQDEEAKSKVKRTTSGRIGVISAKILREKHKWVNTGKPILGLVPGVEVGDEFHWRVELAIIGLHRPYQGGIDYFNKGGGRVVATSIVASGGYDDMDSSDVLVYSGQGGNPVVGDKQAEDQKLERGNLAMKNSMDDRSPVRVIRGFKETKWSESLDTRGKMVATYIYDGLYLVERYWQEKGCYGTNVFMFELKRIPGQPELALKEVKSSKKLRVREGLCVDDISHGKEKMPICAVNMIDNEKPPPFKYITNMIYPSCYNLTSPRGCECTDGCSDSEKCLCAVKNGGEIPFNYNGSIVEAKPLVYECGPNCKCPPSCYNRVSQNGIKFQLEIFKTESRGWGVRSLSSIPSGSFICEYTGELLEDKEAEQRTGNDEYLFDIGNNYNDQTLWDGLLNLIPPDLQSSFSCETVEDVGFTIDAAEYGSVGRFINHCCSPNLYAQNVLYDHDDKRMPHIMLFAAENIPPLQELTYHYNYVLDQVRDSFGNIKKKDCYCGSPECTGRLY